jgi:hypothetical protein
MFLSHEYLPIIIIFENLDNHMVIFLDFCAPLLALPLCAKCKISVCLCYRNIQHVKKETTSKLHRHQTKQKCSFWGRCQISNPFLKLLLKGQGATLQRTKLLLCVSHAKRSRKF